MVQNYFKKTSNSSLLFSKTKGGLKEAALIKTLRTVLLWNHYKNEIKEI